MYAFQGAFQFLRRQRTGFFDDIRVAGVLQEFAGTRVDAFEQQKLDFGLVERVISVRT